MADNVTTIDDARAMIEQLLPGVAQEDVDRLSNLLVAGWQGDERRIKEIHAELPGALQLKIAILLRDLRVKIDRMIRVTSTPAALVSSAKAKVSRFVRQG
jgi:hypothetical protein